jgi:hypothetical protein
MTDDVLHTLEGIDARERRSSDARATRDDVYPEGGEHSFLRDLVATVSPVPVPWVSSGQARERLQRNNRQQETRIELRNRTTEVRVRRLGIRTVGEARALSVEIAGAGAEFAPPQWLVDRFASVARAASPLRRLVTSIEMPPYGMEFYIPRITVVGGVVNPLVTDNINPAETIRDTDQIAASVATFAGMVPLSEQLLVRGNFDQIAVRDMGADYAANLQAQLVNGTGAGGQLLGLLNVSATPVDGVPGAIVNTYTDASPSPAGVVQAIAQTAANVTDARERPPSAVLLRGSRYFWTAGTPEASGTDPAQRVGTGTFPADSDTGPFGPIAGLPVYLDQTIPSTLGSGHNQDAAIVCRAQDIILLEDAPRFNVVIGAAAGGAEMAAFITCHVYAAVFSQRYPSGIGTVTGSGFVVPEGW